MYGGCGAIDSCVLFTEQVGSKGNASEFCTIGRLSVRIANGTTSLNAFYRGFPQSLKGNVGILP
jgi:hypothetical protein